MAPSQPEASRLLSRNGGTLHPGDEQQIEQAGRSTTNLYAQVSAASMRGADRSRSRTSDQPNLLHKKSRPESPTQHSGDAFVPTQAPPSIPLAPVSAQSTRDRSAQLPSSDSARSINSGSSNSNGSSDGIRTREAEAAGIAISAGLPPPPPIPGSRPSQLTPYGSSTSLSRMSTPRSVRDLGHDYTRYFIPFDSRNNSVTDLGTPLPGYHTDSNRAAGVAAGAQSKRFSDPFDDNKQVRGTSSDDQRGVAAGAALGVAATPEVKQVKAINDPSDPEKFLLPVYLDDPGAESRGYNFPLYWDQREDDDDMHLPMVDDDQKMRPTLKAHFTRDTVFSTLGLIFMAAGLLTLFIVLPVLSSTGLDIIGSSDTPLDKMWGSVDTTPEATWATIDNNRTWPLLQNIRTGLIDPDTPTSALTRTALDGTSYKLVFSDEFNDQNRTFYKGDDPYWFAPDIWYGATQDLEWYDPDAVTTWDGSLELRLDAFGNHNLQFRSGMLNSWNQLCFKGGIYEVSVSLPGPGGVHGLWPGVWSMGNLGRPGYLATTDGMWPYTYNECDAGITPNQSTSDGMSKLPGQRLTSCGCKGEDHPTPGTGRGAPEIDIIEVSGDWGGLGVAVATQSFQVAPFDIWWYPNYEFMEIPDYSVSFVNTYTGGPFQQAVSTTTMLNNSWYDGEIYQKYAYEYTPGTTADAEIAWWVGDQMVMRFDGRALGPNGNIGQRIISEEPMSLILNLGLSQNWVDINWAALKFPTVMRVDYVRWYQEAGAESVTCDPPGYETTEYIKNHPEAYNNPNYTHWTDIPGYTWPKNTLMNECT